MNIKNQLRFLVCGCVCLGYSQLFGVDKVIEKRVKQEPMHYTLTIEEAVEIAMRHKPNLQALKYEIEASRQAAKQKLSDYMPNVTLAAGVTGQRVAVANSSSDFAFPQTQVGLTASQLIYSFSGPIEAYKKARKETQKVGFLTDSARNEIKLAVEESFLINWYLQQQSKAIQALQKSSKAKFQQAEHKNELNLLDRNDWLSSVSTRASESVSILNYSEDVMIQQRKLEFLLGQPFNLGLEALLSDSNADGKFKATKPDSSKHSHLDLTLVWNEEVPELTKPLEVYQEIALKVRPDFKASKKTISIYQDAVKIADRANLPVLTFNASTGFDSRNNTHYEGYHSFGFAVSMPLFDGMKQHYESNKAQANVVKSMLENQDTENKIKTEVNDAFHSLTKSLSSLKAKKVEHLQAKNNFELQQQRYDIGDISRVDFENSKTDWESAQLTYMKAQAETKLNERKLYFACGYPEKL